MDYILNPRQIDKLMKPYWDIHFNDAYFGKINLSGEDWVGLIKKDSKGIPELLLGHPKNREEMMWYCDGPTFNGGHTLFSIRRSEFNQSMKRYVKDRFNITTKDIM
jgi:hypothetical protein